MSSAYACRSDQDDAKATILSQANTAHLGHFPARAALNGR